LGILDVVGIDRLGVGAVDEAAFDYQLKRLSDLAAQEVGPLDGGVYSFTVSRRFEVIAIAIEIIFVFSIYKLSIVLLFYAKRLGFIPPNLIFVSHGRSRLLAPSSYTIMLAWGIIRRLGKR
jgi:hypothetical protein